MLRSVYGAGRVLLEDYVSSASYSPGHRLDCTVLDTAGAGAHRSCDRRSVIGGSISGLPGQCVSRGRV
eukprot:8101314-Pyramimonas_sp.AAC.1